MCKAFLGGEINNLLSWWIITMVYDLKRGFVLILVELIFEELGELFWLGAFFKIMITPLQRSRCYFSKFKAPLFNFWDF